MKSKLSPTTTVEVLTSTGVILADGASVIIKVRVLFNATPQPESVIQDTISSYFSLDGQGILVTLSKLKNDPNYSMALCEKIKGLLNVKSVAITGMSLTSPPIESFEEKSKEVTAILNTGETIRLKFSAPPGLPPPPSVSEVKKAYELLSRLKFTQLKSISELLNKELSDPNRGWDYIVLGLEQVSCPCGH